MSGVVVVSIFCLWRCLKLNGIYPFDCRLWQFWSNIFGTYILTPPVTFCVRYSWTLKGIFFTLTQILDHLWSRDQGPLHFLSRGFHETKFSIQDILCVLTHSTGNLGTDASFSSFFHLLQIIRFFVIKVCNHSFLSFNWLVVGFSVVNNSFDEKCQGYYFL